MDLNLFENLKKDIETNVTVKNFINELTNFLNNINSAKTQDNLTNNEDLNVYVYNVQPGIIIDYAIGESKLAK